MWSVQVFRQIEPSNVSNRFFFMTISVYSVFRLSVPLHKYSAILFICFLLDLSLHIHVELKMIKVQYHLKSWIVNIPRIKDERMIKVLFYVMSHIFRDMAPHTNYSLSPSLHHHPSHHHYYHYIIISSVITYL